MMLTPGEQDADWFRQYVGQTDDDTLEWFLERVAIRHDSGLNSIQARNLTYSDYLNRPHGYLRSDS